MLKVTKKRDLPWRIFRDHDEADRADDLFFAEMNPNDRVGLMVEMNQIFAEAFGAPNQGLRRVYRIVEQSRR